MSFFNRLIASVGVGSAKVDTRLEKDTYQVGEQVKGVIHIQGGQVEQGIESINLYLMTQAVKEVDDKKVYQNMVLETIKLNEPFTIGPNERKEVPFGFIIPYGTPVTMGKTRVWLQTGMEIKLAVDPSDSDQILVLPHPIVKEALEGLSHLGFRLREVECEYAPRLGGRYPIAQEFEFIPTTNFRGRLDELEVVFLAQENSVDVLMEVDKKARGLFGALEEALNLDERYVKFKLFSEDASKGKEALAKKFADIISSKL